MMDRSIYPRFCGLSLLPPLVPPALPDRLACPLPISLILPTCCRVSIGIHSFAMCAPLTSEQPRKRTPKKRMTQHANETSALHAGSYSIIHMGWPVTTLYERDSHTHRAHHHVRLRHSLGVAMEQCRVAYQ